MDVAHAILFAKTIDISRVTADYSSAKFEILICTGFSKIPLKNLSLPIYFMACALLLINTSTALLIAERGALLPFVFNVILYETGVAARVFTLPEIFETCIPIHLSVCVKIFSVGNFHP